MSEVSLIDIEKNNAETDVASTEEAMNIAIKEHMQTIHFLVNDKQVSKDFAPVYTRDSRRGNRGQKSVCFRQKKCYFPP